MDQLREVRRLIGSVLGPQSLGSFLHGSAVDGGLRPASDLDVLVVSRRGLDAGRRRALVAGLLPISGRVARARPVELTVVVRDEVRPWRYPPRADFLYGEWLREEIGRAGPPQPRSVPGLAIELTQALAASRPLDGPPLTELLDPVPPGDVVRASVDGIPELLGDLDRDTRNVLLTLARIWTTVATGRIVPKDVAAGWALDRLPHDHRPVLQHARQLYLTTTYAQEEAWSAELSVRVRPHVEAVLDRITRLGDAPA